MIKHTILDAGCWRNAVLLGVDRASGLRSWIRNRYSLYELFAVNTTDGAVSDNAVYREADENTLTFLLPGTVAGSQALVNTCAEFPPSPLFPMREYTPDWSRSGNWSARAYAFDQGPRRYVSWPKPFALNPTSGADILVASPVAVAGWHIRQHQAAVTNNETVTGWEVTVDGTEYANALPWHGYFAVLSGAEDEAGGSVSSDAHRDGRLFRAYVASGTAWVEWRDVSGSWRVRDTGIAADTLAIRIEKYTQTPILYLVYSDAGVLYERTSTDSGGSFSVATTLASSGNPRHPAMDVEVDGLRLTYWVSGTSAPFTVEGLVRDKAGNTIWSGTSLSGVDDAGISVRRVVEAGGIARVYLQAIVSGALTEYVSLDGRTFA